ncbi:transposase [Geomonas agri]|uniref:transposase n=1 Tax=Geomonas agri TaxID=2873702 RepID=UPI003850D61B
MWTGSFQGAAIVIRPALQGDPEKFDCSRVKWRLPPFVNISIPPKRAVSKVIGCIKGKNAIAIASNFGGRTSTSSVKPFWAGGCFVSTIGRDEQVIVDYIRRQERGSKDRPVSITNLVAFKRSQI